MHTAAYIWAGVLRSLEKILPSDTVATWFHDLDVIALDAQKLILYHPSDFHLDLIRHRFTEPIRRALKEEFDMEPAIHFTDTRESPAPQTDSFRAGFTLDSFIPGQNNRFALCAARAVASQPGENIYNPLLIYGPSGVGKTHLLHAIANETLRRNPQARVRYIRSEEFTRDLVESIRSGTSLRFRQAWQETDLLLVDDMQFLAGKEATQEEFYHLYNRLYEQGCQIVLASDRPPRDLHTLADRLTNCFPYGLIADLDIPEPEVREELLRRGAAERQLNLEPEQIAYIAAHVPCGGQQLSGVLNILRAQSLQPDMDMIRRAVAEVLPSPAGDAHSALVEQNVCQMFQISPESLRNHSHGKNMATARLAMVHLLSKLCHMPVPQIAVLMDRDPQTILYLLRCAHSQMDKAPAFREQIRSLSARITAESE